jgi:hypothetical protein
LNTAEKTFEQDFGEVAFSWAAEIIMPDGVLSEKRKNIIDKYVLLLDIDNTVARQIQVDVSR